MALFVSSVNYRNVMETPLQEVKHEHCQLSVVIVVTQEAKMAAFHALESLYLTRQFFWIKKLYGGECDKV